MNKDEIAGLVERWAEHGPATGKTLLEIAVSARMPDEKVNRWCQALQFCSTMADAQHDALTTLSARVETLEAGMSQYLKDGQTPLERMEQDQADILGLMKLLQKEKELTEKLRWALSDAVTTNTESCRERDAALHRIEAARLGIIEGLEMADQKLKVLMLGLPMNGPKAQALLAASAAIHALIGEGGV